MTSRLRPRVIASCLRVLAARLRFRGRVDVGLDTYVGPGAHLVCPKGSSMRLRSTTLSRHVILDVSDGGRLAIGSSFIGPGTIIAAKADVVIGDGCQIADGVSIRDHNHVHGPGVPLSALRFTTAPVVIGDDVWLGAKVVVVAGVTVDDHAVVGAGAVVTRPVDAWARVGGVPARPLPVGDRAR